MKGNFHLKVLDWAQSKAELDFKEILSIGMCRSVYKKNCTNFMYGGNGGEMAESSRRRLSKAKKEYYSRMSEEEYKDFCNKRREAIHSMKPEVAEEWRKKISEGIKRRVSTRTPEEKLILGEKLREAQLKVLSENGEDILRRRSASVKAWHAGLSETERAARSKKCSQGQRNRTPESLKASAEKYRKTMAEKSEEELKARAAKIARAHKSKPCNIKCPNCGKAGKSLSAMQKWHFENCKSLGIKLKKCAGCGDKFDERMISRHYFYCSGD